MRLYLAGAECGAGDPNLGGLGGLDHLAVLISYYAIANSNNGKFVVDWCNQHQVPLFLDSGAYSAMTVGAYIDLPQYTRYCIENEHRFAVMASLDVIGDWKGTLDNHKYMKAQGAHTIPAFHVREPIGALERLLVENEYIAIGVAGMQRRSKKLMAWLVQVFKMRERINPTCKLHGFALTAVQVMRYFDWYSVDSTTWKVGTLYGDVFSIVDGNLKRFPRNQYHKAFASGVPAEILTRRKSEINYRSELDRHNADTMLKWTQYLTNHRSKSSITPQPSAPSARLGALLSTE